MQWSERFVAGRVRKRVLRTPALEGWMADDRGQVELARTTAALTKVDGALAFKPADHDAIVLGELAAAAIAGGECELLIGWPERIVIVRAAGQVLYADGDVVHFGPLALDRDHTLERTGYEYLDANGAEVRVELTVHSRGEERVEMLGPGAAIEVGPYRVVHEHSFDPSDRPGGGARHHGYKFVVTRASPPTTARDTGVPHPLDIDRPEPVLALARAGGFLADDEAVLGEGKPFAALAERYEGPRQTLDSELRTTGPDPAQLVRAGESVQVVSPGLWRGDHGAACYGRVTVTVGPAGGVAVARSELGTMPGRLRKRH